MMMDELMDMLRGVEAGHLEMNAEMAGEVVGAIEILQTKLNRYEELKRDGRLLVISLPDENHRTTMDAGKTLQALRRMKVETGSLVCFACGHEHDCGIRGCAILRNAVEHMEMLLAHYDHLNKLLDDREEELRRFQGTFEDGMRMTNAQKEGHSENRVDLR